MGAFNIKDVIDTHVLVANQPPTLHQLHQQLRGEVIPILRKLQANHLISWHSILLHTRAEGVRVLDETDARLYIHIRLGLADKVQDQQVEVLVKGQFLDPLRKPLDSGVGGLSRNGLSNEAQWAITAAASEFMVKLIEAHGTKSIPIEHITQSLHFVTNPLGLGSKSIMLLNSSIFQF